MKFRIVDKHTEELAKTSSFLAKVKGKDTRIISMLEAAYKKDVSNYDNALAMCFYQWFLADDKLNLADTNSVFQITFDVVNKIEDTLDIRPEYWILWLLKYKIISFMNFNENELIENLKLLIEKQDISGRMDYYLASEILLAHIYYTKGYYKESLSIIMGIETRYSKKICVLTHFFEGFVLEFKNVLLRSGDDELLEKVIDIQKKYF